MKPVLRNCAAHAAVASCFALLALMAAGCASFDAEAVRRDQTAAFAGALGEMEASLLSAPLTLSDCIEIAVTNNYQAKSAQLDRELGAITKSMAFSAFLPQVSASMGYNSFSRDPVLNSKDFETAAIDVSLPVFAPSTWFLYDAARHGAVAAEIAESYVRQCIILQTTRDFYNVLVQEDLIAAYRTQLAAARETSERIVSLEKEGLARSWEGVQARFLLESRQVALAQAERRLEVLRAALLQSMGLSPDAEVDLVDDGERQELSGTLDEMVATALSVHPELALADRMVFAREAQVRQAFCNFIPALSVFAEFSHTGNTVMNPPSENLLLGFRGAWTVFKGFANVSEYKRAKVERRRSEYDRESTFLSVMARVISAEAAARDAADNARIMRTAYDAAREKYDDCAARAREGLIPVADSLDAQTEMDLAQVRLVQSKYAEQIAISNLRLAMGLIGTGASADGAVAPGGMDRAE